MPCVRPQHGLRQRIVQPVGQVTLLDLVEHIGELVSGGVVRDKCEHANSC
jgi:hypothetical protein